MRLNIRSSISAVLAAVVAVATLSACQMNSRAGQGDITLTSGTMRGLERYMNEATPRVFAVSENGQHYTYYYCGVYGAGCRGGTSSYYKALTSCNSKSSSPCKLLATNKDIVWKKSNGDTYTFAELTNPNSLNNLSHTKLCNTVLADDRESWRTGDNLNKFVTEAERRNLTPERCTKYVPKT